MSKTKNQYFFNPLTMGHRIKLIKKNEPGSPAIKYALITSLVHEEKNNNTIETPVLSGVSALNCFHRPLAGHNRTNI